MKLNKVIVYLLVIFTLALFLRVWKLGSVPHGFHSDEVVASYEGTFILRNGVDTYGHFLPIYFDKFGDFRPTGVFYLVGLSNILLGSNVFATRFAVALIGALTTIAVYFLYQEVFGREDKSTGALLAALVLAVLPWHIVLSRSTQESVVGIFLICSGLVFLLRYLRDRGRRHLTIALAMFFLSYFFYTAHRLLVPLLLAAILYEVWRAKRLRLDKILFFIVGASIVLSVLILLTPWGRGRGSQVLIFNNPSQFVVGKNLSFGDGPNNVTVARIFHNKAVVIGRELTRQYFSYFSPDFLFTRGGLPDRYVIPEQGLLYFSLIPILFAGFVAIIKKKSWLPIYFLFVTPLVAFFTADDVPNVNRVSFMIIPFALIAGLGFSELFRLSLSKLINKLLVGALFLFLVLEIVYFGHEYFTHESQYHSIYRNDSFTQTADYIAKNQSGFDKVLVSNSDHMNIYYLFAKGNYDASIRYQMDKSPDKFDVGNVVFIKSDCPSKMIGDYKGVGRLLVIDNGDCASASGLREIAKWVRGDSTQAFKALVQ